MKKTIIYLIVFLLLTCSPAHLLTASSTAGRVQGEFLRIGISGRAAGMGEAFCAVADNASAVYWNPAGLVQLKSKELSATYTNLVGSIRIANLVYGQGMGEKGALGFEVNTLYVEETRRETGTGNDIGSFVNYNACLSVVYSHECRDNLSVGAGVKGLNFQLDSEKASGMAVDLGMLYKIKEGLKAGLAIQNIGTEVQFEGDESAPLATNLKAGIGYRISERGLIASDINKPQYGSGSLSLGGEYGISRVVMMRCGYKLREGGNDLGSLDGISIGLGINIKGFSFDYAFVPFGEFERMNRVSLTVIF